MSHAHRIRFVGAPPSAVVSARSSVSATRRATARFAAACPVRVRLASSPNDTSSDQCSPFSTPQCPRAAPPLCQRFGVNGQARREAPLLRRRPSVGRPRGLDHADAADPGHAGRRNASAGTGADQYRRVSTRPWPRSEVFERVHVAGQRSLEEPPLRVAAQASLVAFEREDVVPAAVRPGPRCRTGTRPRRWSRYSPERSKSASGPVGSPRPRPPRRPW